MNGNGRRIAVSARNADPSPDLVEAGFVKMFQYSGDMEQNTGKWIEMGQRLDGVHEGENFGKRLAMSESGLRVAVASQRWNENRGRVRVFDYSEQNSTWYEAIKPVEGQVIDHKHGACVSP